MTFYLERFLQLGTAWFLLWVSAAGQSGGVAHRCKPFSNRNGANTYWAYQSNLQRPFAMFRALLF